MKAIIIAAGYGSRLGKHTEKLPKALLNINGKSILERQAGILEKFQISEIIVVTGPNSSKFTNKKFQYIEDDNFDEHEQLGSLMKARQFFNEEIIVLFADVLFEEKILAKVVESDKEIGICVDLNWRKNYVGRTEHPTSQADLVLIKENSIVKIQKNLVSDNNSRVGEFIGILKLSPKGAKKFVEHYEYLEKSFQGKFHNADSLNRAYLTDMLQEMIEKKSEVTPIFIEGNWCEIDTVQDLESAKKLFY